MRWLFIFAIVLPLTGLSQTAGISPAEQPGGAAPPVGVSTAGSPSSPSPSPTWKNSLAPLKVRLANAASVKVLSSVLGVELGSNLKQAHAKLDKLCDREHAPKVERSGEETKALWQLAGTDYVNIFVKAEEKDRITSISATLRPGKEMPFEKIGEVSKAPMQDANMIVWDVVRPKRSLFRVVAKGSNRKANTINLFLVERPEADGSPKD